VLVIALPGLGEVQPAGRSAQQLHAQTLLERRYAPAHRRLGDIEAFRGRREAARLDNGDERLQVLESAHIVAFMRTILSR
jgi:hypothetical protein